jgi:transposase InsO family protein
VIAVLVGQGYRPKQCCRILGVAPAGYFVWKRGPVSQAELRRQWLRQVITQAHSASRGTYGYRRVRAELRLGLGIAISGKTVHKLMVEEGHASGLPLRRRRKNLVNVATFEDLVQRNFTRDAPDQLWVTDITEHPTREGKVYCCGVLDAHSRRVVGWSIDTHQASSLVTNALSMALTNRTPTSSAVIHSDHGTQFTRWSFTERVRQAGLAPSMGTVGDAYDNAVIESFWGRLQTELLNRQKWRTRIELSSAIFEYLEVFHNRTRRHSSLGMLTLVDYENLNRGSAGVA